MDVITSRTNPTVRLVRSLLTRRAVRYRERIFVAEGLLAVTSLIENGNRLETLLVDADRQADVPSHLLDTAERPNARSLLVSSEIFGYLSDVETPQPVIGVFAMPELVIPRSPRILVALDGVQDPGNLGSILRTCRAAGVDGVVLSSGTVDPYNPKVVRSTAGQFGDLPVLPVSNVDQIWSEHRSVPERVVIADHNAETLYTEFDWTTPFVLVLGSESAGVGDEWQARATDRVRIDMEAGVESLNVAAAAAVLLFEARRQRESV